MATGNNHWYFDDTTNVQYEGDSPFVVQSRNGVLDAGISSGNITYEPNPSGNRITSGSNVAGYQGWGFHNPGSSDGFWALDDSLVWSGDSNWWLLTSCESFNGVPTTYQGNYWQWFQATSFGGTDYSNTPIGCVCYTAEPYVEGLANYIFFQRWAQGYNVAECGWASEATWNKIVVGDPLVKW